MPTNGSNPRGDHATNHVSSLLPEPARRGSPTTAPGRGPWPRDRGYGSLRSVDVFVEAKCDEQVADAVEAIAKALRHFGYEREHALTLVGRYFKRVPNGEVDVIFHYHLWWYAGRIHIIEGLGRGECAFEKWRMTSKLNVPEDVEKDWQRLCKGLRTL